jgi:hypothetical protein
MPEYVIWIWWIQALARCQGLHEGIDALAGCAPDLAEAMAAVKSTGCGHLNDATVVLPDRSSHPARTARICGGPGSTSIMGGHPSALGSDSLADPGSWCPPRPEHDTTRAKAATELMPPLEQAAPEDMSTLTDLGYESRAGPTLRIFCQEVEWHRTVRRAQAVQFDHPRRVRRR